jgi:hypothetical protein
MTELRFSRLIVADPAAATEKANFHTAIMQVESATCLSLSSGPSPQHRARSGAPCGDRPDRALSAVAFGRIPSREAFR